MGTPDVFITGSRCLVRYEGTFGLSEECSRHFWRDVHFLEPRCFSELHFFQGSHPSYSASQVTVQDVLQCKPSYSASDVTAQARLNVLTSTSERPKFGMVQYGAVAVQ